MPDFPGTAQKTFFNLLILNIFLTRLRGFKAVSKFYSFVKFKVVIV